MLIQQRLQGCGDCGSGLEWLFEVHVLPLLPGSLIKSFGQRTYDTESNAYMGPAPTAGSNLLLPALRLQHLIPVFMSPAAAAMAENLSKVHSVLGLGQRAGNDCWS